MKGVNTGLKRARANCHFVGIVGGSGAGKSWVASQLEARLGPGKVSRLCLDDFYRDRSGLSPRLRSRVNFDHPRAIDWEQLESVLAGGMAGRPVQVPRYNFTTHTRAGGRRWKPRRYVILEGLWLLRRPTLRKLLDLRVFLDCPAKLRLRRRLLRDLKQRGRTEGSVRRQFVQTVDPMHRKFVESQKRHADLVLSSPIDDEGLDALIAKIKELKNRRADHD